MDVIRASVMLRSAAGWCADGGAYALAACASDAGGMDIWAESAREAIATARKHLDVAEAALQSGFSGSATQTEEAA